MKRIPKNYFDPEEPGVLRILSDAEWRGIGITQSLGWEHYEVHGALLLTAMAEMRAFIGTLVTQFTFECDGRTVVPKRWLVSRPYEPARRCDGCVLRVARA